MPSLVAVSILRRSRRRKQCRRRRWAICCLDLTLLFVLSSGFWWILHIFVMANWKRNVKQLSNGVFFGCCMPYRAARLFCQTENKKQACSIKPTVAKRLQPHWSKAHDRIFISFFSSSSDLFSVFPLNHTRSYEAVRKRLKKVKKKNEMSNETSCKPNVLFKL